jgi:transposase-like protein
MGRPAKCPTEFRREVIALVKSSGRPVAEVARSLEIAEGIVWN